VRSVSVLCPAVVRQNNMFNDPTEAINELAALVKKDITDINMQLDNLQEYINSRRRRRGKRPATRTPSCRS